VERISKRGV